MKRFAGLQKLQLSAVVGATLLVCLMGGCPQLGTIFPFLGGPLNVSASSSGDPTVDKTISLVADVSNGTSPYTYAWSQTSGPTVSITDSDQGTATVVPQSIGTYKFQVTVTDSNNLTGVANVEMKVGDIQFNVQSGSGIVVPGNPATVVITGHRGTTQSMATRVTVSDPTYKDDLTTEMTVKYEVVSVPTGAATSDVVLETEFDTFSNAALANLVTLIANPASSFKSLTNIGTTFTNYGAIVPGQYVLRATVVNPDSVARSRDLTVNVSVESLTLSSGFPGASAGPATIAVKTLPTGSPGNVTDKVMTASQTSTLTVSVFPTQTTSYRFYLLDNNGIAHPDLVTTSPDSLDVAAADDPQDITLTIGGSLEPATYTLYWESFSDLGQLSAGAPLTVNTGIPFDVAGLGTGVAPLRFHVTQDFLAQTSINAALVGAASNAAFAPTDYEGWSGGASNGYGTGSVLADVNSDGAMDIITWDTANNFVEVNMWGYVDGSTEALLHPTNVANSNGTLLEPPISLNEVLTPHTPPPLAAGDLNGDNLPDIAIGGTIGGVGAALIFFNTGDPDQPFSDHDDQTLTILAPEYDRRARTVSTGAITLAGGEVRTEFGEAIAIFDMDNDGANDLIVTDPQFSKYQTRVIAAPGAGENYTTNGPTISTFFEGEQGRVYSFKGGATGNLKPGRPDIITSLITDIAITDDTVAPVALSTSFSEANVKYDRAYEGAVLDNIGSSIAVGSNAIAVGSETASGNGTYMGTIQIIDPVADAAQINFEVTGQAVGDLIFRFDTSAGGGAYPDAAPGTGNIILVDLGADNSPSNAIAKLVTAVNGVTAVHKGVTADQNDAKPEQVHFYYNFSAADGSTRATLGFDAAGSTFDVGDNAIVGAAAFTRVNDGVVYRVAKATASGALTNPIYGTTNSDMGLGLRVALGMYNNNTGEADDLAVTAMDDGTDAGVNGDGAVFLLYNGSNDFATATKITDVGAATLGSAGFGGTDLGTTNVGYHLAFGDVNGDNYEDLFFTEAGFDRVYMIKGAATPATKPDLTCIGVVFDDESTITTPHGGSMATTGSLLIGDINGDTQADWLFLDQDLHFGFAGFDRQ